jgi:hypothetical protein
VAADFSLHEQKKYTAIVNAVQHWNLYESSSILRSTSYIQMLRVAIPALATHPSVALDLRPLGCNNHRIHNTHSSPLVTLCSRSHVDHRPIFISTSKTSQRPNILAWWLHQPVPPALTSAHASRLSQSGSRSAHLLPSFLIRFYRTSNRGERAVRPRACQPPFGSYSLPKQEAVKVGTACLVPRGLYHGPVGLKDGSIPRIPMVAWKLDMRGAGMW